MPPRGRDRAAHPPRSLVLSLLSARHRVRREPIEHDAIALLFREDGLFDPLLREPERGDDAHAGAERALVEHRLGEAARLERRREAHHPRRVDLSTRRLLRCVGRPE
jgi:hypothetical protein